MKIRLSWENLVFAHEKNIYIDPFKIKFSTQNSNLNCDKTQKLKKWQLKTKTVTKLKKIKLWQPKNSNCDKTQELKLWQNSKLKFLHNSNSNKAQKLK